MDIRLCSEIPQEEKEFLGSRSDPNDDNKHQGTSDGTDSGSYQHLRSALSSRAVHDQSTGDPVEKREGKAG